MKGIIGRWSTVVCGMVALLTPGCGARAVPSRPVEYARYVNPFIGTTGDGNTFPGATLPFGMVQWSPDTSAGGLTKPGAYQYGDTIVTGFSMTHLSGTGCVAFSNVPFMPTLKPVTVVPMANGSPYSASFTHRQERASPGYYAVRLQTGIGVGLSVTARTGLARISFPRSHSATILINAAAGAGAHRNTDGMSNASVQIHSTDEVTGSATGGHFCGLHNTYTIYFATQFSRPFSRFGVWDTHGMHAGARSSRGRPTGAYLTFDTERQQTIMLKVGVSYVSVHEAEANLRAENRGWSVTAMRQRATDTWNRALGRIGVSGGNAADREIFYTALYHALLSPNVFSDADGRYRGFDGTVHLARGFVQYANFSGWDIYRSEVQLLAWLFPRETSDMMQSLVNDAEQGGWLPKWPVANDYTGEMNGDSADPMIADAYAFGARHFDLAAALRFMVRGATRTGKGLHGYEERPGLPLYLRHGYLPPIAGSYGSAATTLEYAVDDFAVAQLAEGLGQKGLYRYFLGRAQNWRHVFNSATHFVEPRGSDGTFPPSFSPTSPDGFVEGNAWQYTWMVPQDVSGLICAMGGKRAAVRRLNAFFHRLNAGPSFPYYWGGNEPGLEVPWEYDFSGAPWQTQSVTRRIERSLFTAAPNGLPGNEDMGEMSSWYVWAALGLYPQIPGTGNLVLGSPLFPSITVQLPRGKLEIRAAGAPDRMFIRSLQVNGAASTHTWVDSRALVHGGTLSFSLESKPNVRWGTSAEDALHTPLGRGCG